MCLKTYGNGFHSQIDILNIYVIHGIKKRKREERNKYGQNYYTNLGIV